MTFLKQCFIKMFDNAMSLNKKNILDFLEKNEDVKFLDLGCDEGTWTINLAKKIGTRNVYGIDIIDEKLKIANLKGIKITKGSLNKKFPYNDNYFDVIHGNQIIEHIENLDNFVSEIYRILKPGGYVIISTENASSWHNIFASIMGYQIFSLTNISSKALGIGNPFAVHKGSVAEFASWTHKTVFNIKGLIDFFKLHGFNKIDVNGAGYYPLPAVVGKLDRIHSHFITIKAFKI